MARVRFVRVRRLIVLNLEVGGINGNDSDLLPVALDTGHQIQLFHHRSPLL